MQSLKDWINKMDLIELTKQFKDLVTLSFSFFAFVVSAWTFLQKRGETKIAIRKQLTDAIEKLHDINVESSKANDKKLCEQYPNNIDRLLSDQKRFLVRQAKYLAEQIPNLVSPYEEMVIAIFLDDIDDSLESEKWFRRAISRASNQFDEVIARRQYARSLYRNGQVDRAREHFQAASEALQGNTDRQLIYNGDTFERWARVEADFGSWGMARDLVQRAEHEYQKINVDGLRRKQLHRLLEFVNSVELHKPKPNGDSDQREMSKAEETASLTVPTATPQLPPAR